MFILFAIFESGTGNRCEYVEFNANKTTTKNQTSESSWEKTAEEFSEMRLYPILKSIQRMWTHSIYRQTANQSSNSSYGLQHILTCFLYYFFFSASPFSSNFHSILNSWFRDSSTYSYFSINDSQTKERKKNCELPKRKSVHVLHSTSDMGLWPVYVCIFRKYNVCFCFPLTWAILKIIIVIIRSQTKEKTNKQASSHQFYW